MADLAVDDDIDLDVTKYSITDILSIFNIVDPTEFNVTDVANSLIAKMKVAGNMDLVTFFDEARNKVLDYLQNNADADDPETIAELWETAGVEPSLNLNGAHFYDDGTRAIIEERQSAATNANAADPNYKKTPLIGSHIVNIDSQFRSNILPYSNTPLSNTFNTSFIFNLSSPINSAIAMRLYSVQLPTSWYSFSQAMGNTFFIYNGIILTIPDGNYDPQQLTDAINTEAAKNIATQDLTVTYDARINRIAFTNNDNLPVVIIFYIQANVVNFTNCGTNILTNFQTLGINKTLGWLLGFRTPANSATGDVELTVPAGGTLSADVSPNTYGPKYFTLSVEEFSNHRLSAGMISITNTNNSSSLTVPDFYKTIRASCKLREGVLTRAEQYTLNTIINNNKENLNIGGFINKLTGPNLSAALAIIPLAGITALRPEPYIKFGADLMSNVRNYSTPTILTRLSVRLTDDSGALVNLYDSDWSFSLIIEEQLN
jgi:hypothetical protein